MKRTSHQKCRAAKSITVAQAVLDPKVCLLAFTADDAETLAYLIWHALRHHTRHGYPAELLARDMRIAETLERCWPGLLSDLPDDFAFWQQVAELYQAGHIPGETLIETGMDLKALKGPHEHTA